MKSLTLDSGKSRILSLMLGVLMSLMLAAAAHAQSGPTPDPQGQSVADVKQIQGTAGVIRGGETEPTTLNGSEADLTSALERATQSLPGR